MKNQRAVTQEPKVLQSQYSGCFLPQTVLQQKHTGAAGKPGTDRQEVRREGGAASPPLNEQQQNMEFTGTLLEELGRIEAELQATLHLDVERQREAEFLRQQENNLQRRNLRFLSLSQRVAKPWVSSYFRKFPMHIYCLPVQAANHRTRLQGLTKRK